MHPFHQQHSPNCDREFNLTKMHGRQKKERTEEEEVAKEKEHAKKVTAYRYAMGIIFSKRDKKEYDEDLLKITGQVLSSNPDIGTLWNIRKEVLTSFKEADYTHFADVIVPKELDFTEFCLKSNPKSYGSWHHRLWIMRETNFSRVASELKLLGKYLEYDDRNFHCWDYRRYLLNNCPEITLEQEFEFTTEKISSNFSNFSSWHLRSKLLPQLSKDYLTEELELIRNAVFTDPKDQSAWFYHRWLLKSQLSEDIPIIIGAQLRDSTLNIIFSNRVPIPSQVGVDLDFENKSVNKTGSWSNPWCNTRSKLWQCLLPSGTGTVFIRTDESQIRNLKAEAEGLKLGDVWVDFPKYFDAETKPKNDKLSNLLKEELVWVQELQELEPDIKWPISTLIMLLRMIDFVGYKQEILRLMDLLIKLDSKRINYYHDLRSKYLIEWKLLENLKSSSTSPDVTLLDLSKLGLTALYYPERMCFHERVNLSGNALKNAEPFRALLNCQELDITENKLAEQNVKSAIASVQQLKL